MKINGSGRPIMSNAGLGAAVTETIQRIVLSHDTTEGDVLQTIREKHGVTKVIITYHPKPDVDGKFRGREQTLFEFSAIGPSGEVRGRTTI
ncbi:MAG: hypothetical protein Q7S34_04195 [bacterium]|nr:hypothetical protein [bacterium]